MARYVRNKVTCSEGKNSEIDENRYGLLAKIGNILGIIRSVSDSTFFEKDGNVEVSRAQFGFEPRKEVEAFVRRV